MTATPQQRGIPPIFPSMDAAESAEQGLHLRRDATLNRRVVDRHAGAESRDASRERYIDELRAAGLDADAERLTDAWVEELLGDA